MPWWGWVLVGFGAAVALFTWALARAAARGDAMAEAACERYHNDPANWTQERWNHEAALIVDRLKAEAEDRMRHDDA